MSNWKRATLAANIAVADPISLTLHSAQAVPCNKGNPRIKRKTPATTMVELWSKAETGVGPSIAEGSQGCKRNWADLPTAATIRPTAARFVTAEGAVLDKTFFRSQDL